MNILGVLEDSDYRVRVRRHENGILVRLPENLFLKTPERVVGLYVEDGDEFGLVSKGEDREDEFYPIAPYAARTILHCLVLEMCSEISYSPALVEYSLEDGTVVGCLSDLVDVPEEAVMEDVLAKLVFDGLENGFSDRLESLADSLGCGREFRVCVSIIFGEES